MAENQTPTSPTKPIPQQNTPVIEQQQQQSSNSQQLQTMQSPSDQFVQQQQQSQNQLVMQNQQQSQMVQAQHQLQQLQQQLQSNNNTNGIQGIQRNASMSRLNNQSQQNSGMNNQLGIMRQQQQQGSGIYGQMSFGGMTALQQQQQQQNANASMISNNNNNSQLQNQQIGQQNQLQQQQQLGQQNQLQQQQIGQQNQLQQQQIGQQNQFQQQQQQIGQQNQLHQQMGQQNQLQQSQLGQMGSGNFSRSSFMGQTGHLPLLSGQAAVAAAAQFGIHNQFMSSPRQKTGLAQGSQFHLGNSAGQSFPGIQGMGMPGSLNLSSQLRPNGALSYAQAQRMTMTPTQLRQQLTQQNALAASQKMQGQNITRTSFMNGQISALAQNGPPALMQSTLSQQQYLKQVPSISSPNTSAALRLQQQRQQQLLLQQQLASSQFNQSSVGMNQQQVSPIVQQLGQSQVHQQKQQLMQQQPSPQLLNQQQSPRMVLPGSQKSASLTGSQQDISATGTATPGGSSSQGIDATLQLLGKRKIQDLVSQMDPNMKLTPELEEWLLEMADAFINTATDKACALAKHRNSSTVEAKDVLLHLEKDLNLKVPGYSSDEMKHKPDNAPSEAHKKRMDAVRNLMEPMQSEPYDTAANNNMGRQGPSNNPGGSSQMMIRPSPSSEQLVSQPQMMQQQTTRFS